MINQIARPLPENIQSWWLEPYNDIYSQAKDSINLGDDEVHIWHLPSNVGRILTAPLFETLSQEEKEKAGKFYFEDDCERFVYRRGALRQILGNYLNISPSELRFSYNKYGKPNLAEESSLRFNVSYTKNLLVIAVTQSYEIGIDIEHIDHNISFHKIGSTFFSKDEIEASEKLPEKKRTEALFQIWTGKEACIKSIGIGFSFPPNQMSIPIMDENSATSVTFNHFGAARDLSLCSLPKRDGHAIALAIEGKPYKKISSWDIQSNLRDITSKANLTINKCAE